MNNQTAVIFDSITNILNKELKPVHLEIMDESHLHSRRTEENPETHFKVIVVSEMFVGLTRVRRQQLVYAVLSRLFKTGLHALTQVTFTPTEWANVPKVNSSPHCAGKKS